MMRAMGIKTIFAAVGFLALGAAGAARATPTLDQSNSGSLFGSSAIYSDVFGHQSFSQGFTVGLDGTLNSISVDGFPYNSVANSFDLAIETVDGAGGPTGTVLATASIAASSVVNGYNIFDLTGAALSVTAGEQLAFVLTSNSPLAADPGVWLTNTIYPSGSLFMEFGSGWVPVSAVFGTNAALLFQTFVDATPTPEPASLIVMGAGLAGLGALRGRKRAQ